MKPLTNILLDCHCILSNRHKESFRHLIDTTIYLNVWVHGCVSRKIELKEIKSEFETIVINSFLFVVFIVFDISWNGHKYKINSKRFPHKNTFLYKYQPKEFSHSSMKPYMCGLRLQFCAQCVRSLVAENFYDVGSEDVHCGIS